MSSECSKMVFMSTDKQKEWDELEPRQKEFVMNHLAATAAKMENKIAIEMLCHVINELMARIEKLEKYEWPCKG